MINQIETSKKPEIIYPDSDGQPMSDNTKQFRWIVIIKENLEILFADNSNVFVAGDLLWYPVEGDNTIRRGPDILVAFGRPKGDRGSYKQWLENNIPPQVVFEILSPGNTLKEMAKKLEFYERHGVEEYYLYDPDEEDLTGWLRSPERLEVIEQINGWQSPRLGISFELTPCGLEIKYPTGEKFLSSVELHEKAEAEKQRAEAEKQRADQAEERIKLLEARLKQLGMTEDL